MLVTLQDILMMAEQRHMAVAAFNTPSLEVLRAAIDASEETGFPVIVSHAIAHETLVPLDTIGPVMVALGERASTPVCVHLDHGYNFEHMHKALELGFTGVMFDGSRHDLEDNIRYSRMARRMAAAYGVGIECEIGCMGIGYEGDEGQVYTDPAVAERFVEETGCDALACSFGTVHGMYRSEPKLSVDIVEQVRQRTGGIPVVMHGGSGVSDDDYLKVIGAGVRKINYYTYGALAAGRAADARVRATEGNLFWHDLTKVAYETFRENCVRVMGVFSNGADPSSVLDPLAK